MTSYSVSSSLTRRSAVGVFLLTVSLLVIPTSSWAQPVQSSGWSAPRTAWDVPDIGGLWNSSTVTPLERPENHFDKEYLTEEEAAAIEQEVVARNSRANAPSAVRTERRSIGSRLIRLPSVPCISSMISQPRSRSRSKNGGRGGG